jgi:diguanylate cyclase (GGDEF)-like protein
MDSPPAPERGTPVAAAPAEAQQSPVAPAAANMARVGSWLYTLAAVVVAAPVVLPHADPENAAALMATAGALATMALLLGLAGPRLSVRVFPALSMAATLLVASAVYFEGNAGGPAHYELLFGLMTLYAAYFYERRMLGAQIAVIAVSYGAALALAGPGAVEATHWLVSVGTFVVLGVVVRTMKENLDELIERLSDVARTDFLTGLTNRRGFVERFDYELEVARRSGRPMTLLIGDIDRFKELNDRFGHASGDKALARIGKMFEATRRNIDTAARLGGEEFAMILPFTDTKGGFAVAERVRAELAEVFGAPDGSSKPARRGMALTMSFGIVNFPAHGQTAEALMHAGDQALYTAKREGRNRSVVFRPDTIPKYAGTPVAPRSE